MKFKNSILALAVVLALGRIFITPRLALPTMEGSYEAVAHLVDGFLIIAPFYDRKQNAGPSHLYGWAGWLFAFWEAGWFAVQKAHGG